jgi:hypothetical protein
LEYDRDDIQRPIQAREACRMGVRAAFNAGEQHFAADGRLIYGALRIGEGRPA